MKTLCSRVLRAASLLIIAAAFAATAPTAEAYSDSIGINISDGGSGAVSGTPTGQGGYVADQANWNNWAGSFTSPVDASGAPILSGLLLTLSGFGDSGPGGGAAGTLAYFGYYDNFDDWYYGNSLTITNIPYASFDVATLDGWYGNSVGWHLWTGPANAVTPAPPDPGFKSGPWGDGTASIVGNTFSIGRNNGEGFGTSGGSIFAIQILSKDAGGGPDYATYIAGSSPVGWWGMNETGGNALTTTPDLSGAYGAANNGLGNNVDMTYGNPASSTKTDQPGYVLGSGNRATRFTPQSSHDGAYGNGAEDNTTSAPVYRHTSGMSGEVWAQLENPAGPTQRFMSGREWSFGIEGGQLMFTMFGVGDYLNGGAVPTDGLWHQFGFSWDGASTMSFFIDGVLMNTVTGSSGMRAALNPGPNNFCLGRRRYNSEGQSFYGYVDEAVIWNHTRTAQDFADSLAAAGGPDSGTSTTTSTTITPTTTSTTTAAPASGLIVGVKYAVQESLAPTDVAGVPAYAQANWNMAPPGYYQGPPATPITGLLDNSGAATTINLTSWTQTPDNAFGLNDTVFLNSKLITDFSCNQPSLTFAGLGEAFIAGGYKVIVYYSNNEGPTTCTLSLNGLVDDSASREIRTGPTTSCAYSSVGFVEETGAVQPPTQSSNYTIFDLLNDPGFTVAFAGAGNNGIAAIQIVANDPSATTVGTTTSTTIGTTTSSTTTTAPTGADSMNINLGDGTGVPGSGGDVAVSIATPQYPASGNWNNLCNNAGYLKGWDSNGANPGWGGAVKTSHGTNVATGTGKFYIGFYAEDYFGASASWNTGGGAANTLLNNSWTGNSGTGGNDFYGDKVPFSNYTAYYLTGDGSWHSAGTFATPNFTYKLTGSGGSITIAAVQIVEVTTTTVGITTVGTTTTSTTTTAPTGPDSMNINLGDGTGVPGSGGDVAGSIATPQYPASGNWNNLCNNAGYLKGWDSNGANPGWGGAVKTSHGTNVATGTGKFYIGFYAEDYFGASASWNTGGGAANTLLNNSWTGNSGTGGNDFYGDKVPFSNYTAYYLTGDGAWHSAGTFATPNFTYKLTGSGGSITIAAVQIVEVTTTSSTSSTTTAATTTVPTTSSTTVAVTTTTSTTCSDASAGTIAKQLTLTGYTGSIQWQASGDGVGWGDIGGETSATLDVSGLYVVTPYFRAKVTQNSCVKYSPSARVTDASGGATWIMFK